MTISDTLLAASFMTSGMLDVDASRRVLGPDGRSTYDIYIVWDQGGLELHHSLTRYAIAMNNITTTLVERNMLDFPGVIDYEVSEPFGAWFANYVFAFQDAPPDSVGLEKLVCLLTDFFYQVGSDSDTSTGGGMFADIVWKAFDPLTVFRG